MRKRNLVPKMVVVAAPALLPLAALARPGEGRNPLPPAPVTAQRAHPGQAVPAASLQGVNASAKVAEGIAVHPAGQVLLPDGSEAAHATVVFSWMQSSNQPPFHKVVCDAHGKFDAALSLTPNGNMNGVSIAMLNVTALLPGKGLAWTQVAAANQEMEPIKLRLMPGTTLEGRLVKPDGAPASGTEVRLATLLPRSLTRNGVPATPATTDKPQTDSRLRGIQQSGFPRIMALMPDEDLAALFHATTDANGKFVLNGVPRETNVTLDTSGKLALASGSARSFVVLDRERQSAGLLVATPTGSFKARLIDPVTGKPAPPTFLTVSAVNPTQSAGLMQQMRRAPNALNRATNAQGEYISPQLLPGEYDIHVMGCVKRVRVEANRETPPVEIALRHGALKGRLLDAEGNPIANAEIRLAVAGDDSMSNGFHRDFTQTIVFNGDSFSGFSSGNGQLGNAHILMRGGQAHDFFTTLSTVTTTVPGGVVNLVNQTLTKTGPDGSFVIDMPWGSPAVRLWSVRGNDLAEWSGPASKLDATLTLKMQRNALVSVTGALIDPERRPIANARCKALHWLSTPRATWFATARDVQTDKDGNFTVSGLERGESFSLITTGQQGGNRLQLGRVSGGVPVGGSAPGVAVTAAVDVNSPIPVLTETKAPPPTHAAALPALVALQVSLAAPEFESPRFITCANGDAQALGAVMVHPQDTPEEVMQSYGGSGSMGDQPILPGVVANPTPADVRAAQQALARFESALKTGDVHALEQLTSRVSPGWSENKPEFLQNVSLCGRTDAEGDAQTAQCLRFVPRDAVAALLAAAPAGAQIDRSELDNMGQPALREANWVFLAKPQGDKIMLAGVLHRENGQWRVVANPFFSTQESLQAVHFRAGQIAPDAWAQTAPQLSPVLDADLQAAQQTGQKYLQTWLAGDKPTLHSLTSPFSPLAATDVDQFRHLLEKRKDDGVCPLATGETMTLQPVTDLNRWEQAWLKLVAGMTNSNRFEQLTRNSRRLTDTSAIQLLTKTGTEDKSGAGAAGSDLAVFRYTAQGHDFLMLLTRQNQKWQMLEPALPL